MSDLHNENELLDLQPEYTFDYRKARPNRFASRLGEDSIVIVLDPDVAQVFTSAETVNAVLRALIHTMPNLQGSSEIRS